MSHPDTKQLQLFAAGRLDDAEAEQIEKHLENCPDCLKLVAGFERSPADPLLDGLKAVGRGNVSPDSDSFDSTKTYGMDSEFSAPIPDFIGNYAILGVIGSGGMGTVYRGENPHLRRHAAIKVVKPSRSLRGSSIERFQRELIANGKLQHKHIVAVFDGGMFETRPYLVMELLDGTDLAQYVKDNTPLPVKEACEIICQVALGLQYVHETGLIHRDIKPSNLFRTNDETIKILDLGLARLLESETCEGVYNNSTTTSETLDGQILGTPDYMSPEQAVGSNNVGFHSDIYSLGCTFFYLLTGKAPFGATTEISAKIDAHVNLDLPPLKSFRNDVPPVIKKLLRKMTSKKITERPRASEVVAVLRRYITLSGKDTIVRYLYSKRKKESQDEDHILKRIKYLVAHGADVNAKDDKDSTPLHWAAVKDNNIKVVQFLVSKGADVHAKNASGSTPLHGIMSHKNVEVAQFLISQGSDVNTKDNDGATPLHRVARLSIDIEFVQFLVSKGANVNVQDKDGTTPLHWIARANRNVEFAQFFVSKGADVNAKDVRGLSPLHWATTGKHNVKVAQFLVSHGADVKAKDKDGNTPLHLAAWRNNNVRVARFLISQGADVNAKNDEGRTPLHLAAEKNENIDVIEYLISQEADVNMNANDGTTPLHQAVEKVNLDVIEYLLSQGAGVNTKNDKGRTPLHLAATRNNIKIVQLLISQGADVNAKNNVGDTPLHSATRERKNVKVIQYLITQGADVNTKNNEGRTPFHLATRMNKNDDIIEYLISEGADVNTKANDGDTPLHSAVWRDDYYKFVRFLISQGADINAKGTDGNTLLHEAAGANKNIETLQFLVSQGADVNTENNMCAIPLHQAALGNKNVEVFQFLISQGADVNAKDNEGNSPLHYAMMWIHNMELVPQRAHDNMKADDDTTLHPNATKRNNHVNIVQCLVSQGAVVEAKNDNGETPLHLAAMYNKNVEVVKFLVFHGADVNAQNKNGDTPLHLAAEGNDIDGVDFHIHIDAGQVKPDKFAHTIHWAATRDDNANVAQFLVSQGANVNAKNKEGYTPLDLVKKKKNAAAAEDFFGISEQMETTSVDKKLAQATTKGESNAE